MPINKILDYIFGSVTVKTDFKYAEKILNVLHRNKIIASRIKKNPEDGFSFKVRLSKAEKVKTLLDKSGIKVYSIRGEGLPFLLKRYRKRYGIAAGALIFCAFLWVSKLFVWQVKFSGNENIPDGEVEELLLDSGFGVGTYIPNVDFYTLCNVFLQNTDDFSYVSVNMEGTTATVELRERKKKNEQTEYEASNLVAKYSGQIESMTVYSGKTVIEKEAVVREGELLVSGFLEKNYGFEIVRSTGSVYAYITRTFDVEIPFEKDIKVYTGNSENDVELTFFGKNINIFSPKEKNFELSDIQTDRERLVLFDRIKLPLILTKITQKEYRLEKVILDEAQAKKEAEKEMSRIMAKELADSEVLERKTKEEISENSYKLTCEIYCLTDIALEKEILLN